MSLLLFICIFIFISFFFKAIEIKIKRNGKVVYVVAGFARAIKFGRQSTTVLYKEGCGTEWKISLVAQVERRLGVVDVVVGSAAFYLQTAYITDEQRFFRTAQCT